LTSHDVPYSLRTKTTHTTKLYTLSLHDALPISHGLTAKVDYPSPGCEVLDFVGETREGALCRGASSRGGRGSPAPARRPAAERRSGEDTSELQSRGHFVCCLLLENKITDRLLTR